MQNLVVSLCARRRSMDCRVKCLARGHDRQLFGDITDTFGIGQVYVCDVMGTEEDTIVAVTGGWSDGEALALECLRNLPEQ